ncbi:response regulator [candidate division WOR-3 bacterium]|nr:response regulator [candidate division WOR-3 bacterium]
MESPRILIIDDEKAICDACAQILSQEHYVVEVRHDGESGLAVLDEFRPDVVFVDLKMPGLSGIEVLSRIRERDATIVSIVITGFATIESAVDSMKVGAFDFLPKPFSPDQLRIITKRALASRMALLEAARLRDEKEKMRQNYISMVSHELRIPLVAVMQYLEVLRNGFAGSISDEQSRIMTRMKVRLSELLALIDRWLKLSRLEELKLQEGFRQFALQPVVEEAIELINPLAVEHKITVTSRLGNGAAIVYGEREMIKEVLVNLINNGIKYNKEGGTVTVALKDSDDFWVLDISDTGAGIPQEDIPRVGEEFFRVRREGSAAGSGIGLAIVKKIIDIHDGKLAIESALDQGSTFSVYLPKPLPSKGEAQ